MKGAKGVIISITGGEDMRLMEVDEAANHIKELVDPDANIIWGSAFNDNLDGKIRVSVVATGIEAEAVAAPEPARVLAFPAGRKAETAPSPVERLTGLVARAEEAPAAEITLTPPEPAAEEPVAEAVAAEEAPLTLDQPVAEDSGADELLLDEPAAEPSDADLEAGRRWLSGGEPEAKPARVAGGTLFERMSSIARGNAKTPGDDADRESPLDIPRFLNRQNNP